jgi:hypothetical protein
MRIAYLCAACGHRLILACKTFRSVFQQRIFLQDLTSKLQVSFVRPVRAIGYCLASLMLPVMCGVSYAETIPATLTSVPPIVKYTGYSSLLDTPEAACRDWVAHQFDTNSYTGLLYDHYEPYLPGNFNMFKCYILNPNGYPPNAISWWSNTAAMRSCDGIGGWAVEEITCKKYTCPAEQNWTLSGTNCTRPDCPIPALTAPPFNDACSQALENLSSTQAQKYAACGSLTPAMQTGKACLESKLAAMTPAAIPFVMTGNIRSVAYQAHFRDIWDKMEKLAPLMRRNPAMQTACAARRAEIAAEKGCDNAGPCVGPCYAPSSSQRSHCLRGRPANPSPNLAQHTQGNAIDVSGESTIEPLQTALDGRNPPQNISQFLDAPTTAYPSGCNLIWGGTFTNNYDPVHFLAR